ncbi:hypothetical protein ACFX13_014313 [Malus domestica]
MLSEGAIFFGSVRTEEYRTRASTQRGNPSGMVSVLSTVSITPVLQSKLGLQASSFPPPSSTIPEAVGANTPWVSASNCSVKLGLQASSCTTPSATIPEAAGEGTSRVSASDILGTQGGSPTAP